ncbi:PREDICTED: uncharacterized protein LOC104807249 [Tarenaya hassleriana]|uniref:uncharacterized protein LOC104807249 n=1 Tax=Tarenaya hassleriana TaxID=28532 RepID=UPI00053C2047|nr:PREDICTED: uncharacterized protein LOC104807249 [Tarenaya hassleriana]
MASLSLLLFLSLQSLSSAVSAASPENLRREEYRTGKIYDITHQIRQDLPSKATGDKGLGQFLWPSSRIKNGNSTNMSTMKLTVHSVTHLDAPGHYIDRYYFDSGFDVDTLDLDVLNGPALLVDVPKDKHTITAEVMESLDIPKGVTRVLFRTSNTHKQLMYKKEYDRSFVGFNGDGARWLVQNTDIKLLGIDYFSVGSDDDSKRAHLEFLESREIIPVEGLKLDDVPAGLYSVHCLPLRLFGAEGSPVRCILIE